MLSTERKEFALIQLISDETERQQALDQLNAKYNSDRLAAAQQYAQTLASIIMPVWQQEDIQGAAADIDALTQKLREYSAADESEKPGILEDINEITAAMDEGAVTEYIALLMQVQSLLDSGMTEAEVQSLFPELDFSGAMDQIAAIQTFLTDRKNLLPGLESMFSEAIPDEVLKIATDLDMTGAQARWDEFAQNPGAITTEAIISGYGQQEGVEPPNSGIFAASAFPEPEAGGPGAVFGAVSRSAEQSVPWRNIHQASGPAGHDCRHTHHPFRAETGQRHPHRSPKQVL